MLHRQPLPKPSQAEDLVILAAIISMDQDLSHCTAAISLIGLEFLGDICILGNFQAFISQHAIRHNSPSCNAWQLEPAIWGMHSSSIKYPNSHSPEACHIMQGHWHWFTLRYSSRRERRSNANFAANELTALGGIWLGANFLQALSGSHSGNATRMVRLPLSAAKDMSKQSSSSKVHSDRVNILVDSRIPAQRNLRISPQPKTLILVVLGLCIEGSAERDAAATGTWWSNSQRNATPYRSSQGLHACCLCNRPCLGASVS